MAGYEFRVHLTRDEVQCAFDSPEATNRRLEPQPLRREPHLETIKVLEAWLRRWERIETAQRNTKVLLVPETFGTFETLGNLLWRLAFEGTLGWEVDAALDEVSRAGEETDQVRLRISFGGSTEDLAVLPWEFLRNPNRGRFLVQEANLMLARFLSDVGEEQQSRQPDDQLNILFITALPTVPVEGEDRFASERAALHELITHLDAMHNVTVHHIDFWDPEAIQNELKGAPDGQRIDVVHLVGISKESRGEFSLLLSDSDGVPQWTAPMPVVDVLTRNTKNRPSLVVLHLVDDPTAAPTSHFEQLAPHFVRANTAAVLALQYPMPPDAGTTFARLFYEELANAEAIGDAVRTARAQFTMRAETSRRMGAPVLYLRCEPGMKLVRGATDHEGEITDAEEPTSSGVGDMSLRAAVLRAAREDPPTSEKHHELRAWAERQDWPEGNGPDQRRQARVIVRAKRQAEADDKDTRQFTDRLYGAIGEMEEVS